MHRNIILFISVDIHTYQNTEISLPVKTGYKNKLGKEQTGRPLLKLSCFKSQELRIVIFKTNPNILINYFFSQLIIANVVGLGVVRAERVNLKK